MLVDFGSAKPYLKADSSEEHICKERNVKFRGNVAFSSRNAFKHVTLSRRDDLISLCYNLVFFFYGKQDQHARLIRDDRPHLYDKVSMLRKLQGPL